MKTPQPHKPPEAVDASKPDRVPQAVVPFKGFKGFKPRQASAVIINITPGTAVDTVQEYFVSFTDAGGHLPAGGQTVSWTIDGNPQDSFTIGDAPTLRTGTVGVGADIAANMNAGSDATGALIAGPVANLHVDLPG